MLINIKNKLLKNRLFKEAGSYTFWGIVERSVPFLILPIITRHITPEEYGVFSTFQAIVAFLIPFISLNSDSAVLRFYYDKEYIKFEKYFSSAIIIISVAFIIVIVIFTLFISLLQKFVLDISTYWFYIFILIAVLQILINLNLNLFQIWRKPNYYGMLKIFITISKTSLMLYFVLALNYNWDGLIISQLITFILVASFSIYFFFKKKLLVNVFDIVIIKKILKLGSPLTLHNIGGWANSLGSRILLTSLIGTAATGNFSVGASFGIIVVMLQDAFNRAYVPFLFEKLSNININIKKKLVKLTYIYHFSILLFSFVVGIIGMKLTTIIFGEGYSEASKFVLWITMAYAFHGMYKMHVNYLFYQKKTSIIAVLTLITGILNLGISLFFIKIYGEIGVAIALFTTYLLIFFIVFYLANRYLPMPWKTIFYNNNS